MSKRDASISLLNELQPDLEINLNPKLSAVITYASHLRLVTPEGNDVTNQKSLPDVVLVTPDSLGMRLTLVLWHGRPSPELDMDDWGYDTDGLEGYPGDLTGDAFIITKDGVTAVDYNDDGTRTCTMADFHGDVLKYGGEHYWGDFSINQGAAA